MWRACHRYLYLLLLCISPIVAIAQLPSGQKSIVLFNDSGERHTIGTVVFTPVSDTHMQFKISLDRTLFGDYFLAMRPFKCLGGGRQHYCHFPLDKVGTRISAEDLLPLEYALMFMHKKPAGLSLDSRNGLFYQLKRSDKGFSGRVFDVDMEPIIVPDSVPASQRLRPIRYQDLHKADPSAYWLPYLSIE
ncbi:MAG: hypothetical protein RLZZ502_888 [Pseudomonadota bacterium]